MPFTDKDREKGRLNSAKQRQKQQAIRREKAKKLFDTGMPKIKIAKALGVNPRTIDKDLKVSE